MHQACRAAADVDIQVAEVRRSVRNPAIVDLSAYCLGASCLSYSLTDCRHNAVDSGDAIVSNPVIRFG